MINKIYKTINNKFSRLFKFIFFLRYLFGIFFVAIIIFITFPHFFDYQKKRGKIIKLSLLQNYGLKIKTIEDITFHSFPLPHLQLKNVYSNFYSEDTSLFAKKILIFPKLTSIYNYQNFQLRKMGLENAEIKSVSTNFKSFISSFLDIKKKLFFENLNLNVIDYKNKNSIINFEKITYLNYGYKKNVINGKVFNKKFKIKIKDDFSSFNFSLPNVGVSIILNTLYSKKDLINNGLIKGKILESNFKFNYIYDNKTLKINNLYFRDKNFSFDGDGDIQLKPFFSLNQKLEIRNFNPEILKNIDILKFLNYKSLIKKLNSKNNLIYKRNRFGRSLIENFESKSELAYGRLTFSKFFSILENKFYCNNNVNLLQEYPILAFECSLESQDKKKLLELLEIDYIKKNEKMKLNFSGKLNILNQKINFDNVTFNNDYNATEEDLNFFKDLFEATLFEENFFKIFDLSKIKKFILEIL